MSRYLLYSLAKGAAGKVQAAGKGRYVDLSDGTPTNLAA